MSKRLLMAEQWDSFCRAVMPPDAPPNQRKEMRRAFYAGAKGFLFSIGPNLSPEDAVTAADEALIVSLAGELAEFESLVKAGRA